MDQESESVNRRLWEIALKDLNSGDPRSAAFMLRTDQFGMPPAAVLARIADYLDGKVSRPNHRLKALSSIEEIVVRSSVTLVQAGTRRYLRDVDEIADECCAEVGDLVQQANQDRREAIEAIASNAGVSVKTVMRIMANVVKDKSR